jgi:NAD(P)-dependent dehydrogenase (short-subunit alcohol dehydrogenase family)
MKGAMDSLLAVSGAAQGIGRAVARHFASHGYGVSFIDPNPDAARQTINELHSLGARVIYENGDIAREDDVRRWVDATVRELGVPSVLVNNAGIEHREAFLELPPAEFDRVLAVNLRGTFLCSQAYARQMARRGNGGAIVNIASTRAIMSEPNTEAYSASKGGIVALTHAMAMSLSEHRIRVNCISPGWIETERAPVSGKRAHPQHPVGRVGKPEDVAEACLFLAEYADFMTGQNIVLDGGMTRKMIYEE